MKYKWKVALNGMLILITSALLNSCHPERYNVIPDVYVQLDLHITNLATIGPNQMKSFPGGVGGIIIFNHPFEGYLAYDRTCTYEPAHNCAVLLGDTIPFPVCPCCGSKFILELGAFPQEGSKARMPLKQYNTTRSGDMLFVRN